MPMAHHRDRAAICRDHSATHAVELRCAVDERGLSSTVYPPQRLESQRLNVAGDFSSAAFFIVAGLLGAANERLIDSKPSG